MFFLGIFCLISSCVASPIISNRESKLPTDGQLGTSQIVLEPIDLSDEVPWATAHSHSSKNSRVFLIKGLGGKKFDIFNVFKEPSQESAKVEINDKTEPYKFDRENQNNGAKNDIDCPCKETLNEKSSFKVTTPSQIDEEQNSVTSGVSANSDLESSNKHCGSEKVNEIMKLQPTINTFENTTLGEELIPNEEKEKPDIKLNIQPPSSIDITMVQDTKTRQEIYILLKNNSTVNGVKSASASDISVPSTITDSFKGHRLWTSENINQDKIMQPAVNNNALDNIAEISIPSEEEIKPVKKLHNPAPLTIDRTGTLPTGFSSLLANNKHVAAVQEVKPEIGLNKVIYLENDTIPAQSSIDVPFTHDTVQIQEVNEDIKQEPLAVSDEHEIHHHHDVEQPLSVHEISEENYPKINKVETAPEEVEACEEVVKPRTPLHIPPPPSLDDAIVLPSGYSTLEALRNEEKILLLKIYREKYLNQKQSEKVYLPKKTEPTVRINAPVQQLQYTNPHPEANEFNSFKGSITSEEQIKPVVKLNILAPAPSSVISTVAVPSEHSSSSTLEHVEKIVTQNDNPIQCNHENPQRMESKLYPYSHSEVNNVGVEKKKVVVEVQRNKPEYRMKDVENTLQTSKVTEQQPFAVVGEHDEIHHHHQNVKQLQIAHAISEENYPKTNKIEMVPEETEAYEEDVQPKIELHIPPPPSLDGTIVLPSEYPTLETLRNEEKMLLLKINAEKHQNPDQRNKNVEVKVTTKQSNDNGINVEPAFKFIVQPSPSIQLQYKNQRPETYESNRFEKATKECVPSEEQIKPVIKLNKPGTSSTDNIFSENSSVLQNNEHNILHNENKSRLSKSVISVKNYDLTAPSYIEVQSAHDPTRWDHVTGKPKQQPFADSDGFHEDNYHRTVEQPSTASHEISEENYPKTNKIETVVQDSEAEEEYVKPRILLHIPPPPSIDGTIVLPSGYSKLAALRNDEKILQLNDNERKHQQQYHPEFEVGVTDKQSNGNVESMDPTVKYNIPSSLQSVIPSQYLTVSNLNDIKRILQKLIEQRRKLSTKVSGQKLEAPDTVQQVKHAVKINIPAPPSINGRSSSSGYQILPESQNPAKYNVKMLRQPEVNVHKPNIVWNTPASPSEHRSVKFSSGFPSLSDLENKAADKEE